MKITYRSRCALISRVAAWCFDNTESRDVDHIGRALAYLFWTVAAHEKISPLDITEDEALLAPLVALLRANPNGLLDELIEKEVITL